MIKRLEVFDDQGTTVIPFLKSSFFISVQDFEHLFMSKEKEVLSLVQQLIHAKNVEIVDAQMDTDTVWIINNTQVFADVYSNAEVVSRIDQNGIVVPLTEKQLLIIGNKLMKFTQYDVQKILPCILYLKKLIKNKKTMEIDELKNLFLASISHEIRTPLNGIIGISQLLEVQDPKQQEYLNILKTCTVQLIELINDILDYSKLRAHQMTLTKHPFRLKKAIDDAIDMMRYTASQKQNSIQLTLVKSLPTSVIGDERRIKQILMNLISNAIKFTENGNIEIIIDVETNHDNSEPIRLIKHTITCQVNDTGCGIPKYEQDHIFDVFSKTYQSYTFNTTLNPGAGLGLSIVKQLVELMDGTIMVYSDGQHGSSFCFNIVLEDDTDIHNLVNDYDTVFKDRVVCIIDDNSKDRILLMNLLQTWKCHVFLFSNVEEFEYYQGTPDVVLLNVNLYNLSYKRVFKKVPIIGLRAMKNITPPSVCTFCLDKPVSRSPLFNSLSNIFMNPRRQRTRKPSHEMFDSHNVRIIIAEDDFYNQLLLKEMLCVFGIPEKNITITNNGQECIDAIHDNVYDICFMDVKMPVMDGLQATEIIKTRHPNPIVVSVSASILEKDYQLCFDAGADYFIEKPINKDKLFSLLKNLIV